MKIQMQVIVGIITVLEIIHVEMNQQSTAVYGAELLAEDHIKCLQNEVERFNNVLKLEKRLDHSIKDHNAIANPDSSQDDLSDYYIRLGLLQYRRGDLSAAWQSFTDAIKANSGNARAYHNRGVACLRGKKFNNAITDFSAAIRIDNRYAVAYANRALAYENIGDREHAMADYRAAKQLGMDCDSSLARVETLPKCRSHEPQLETGKEKNSINEANTKSSDHTMAETSERDALVDRIDHLTDRLLELREEIRVMHEEIDKIRPRQPKGKGESPGLIFSN